MKKTTSKAKVKGKKVDTQYGEFLAIKQKEYEAALMNQAQAEVAQDFGYGEDSPVYTPPTSPPEWEVLQGELESPPTGNVKAFRTKKTPVKQPTVRNQPPTYADEPADLRTYVGRGSNSLGMSIGGDSRRGGSYTKYGAPAIMEPVAHTEDMKMEVLPEMEASEAKLPSDMEQFDEVRNALRLIRSPDRTLIYCIVVDKQNEKNVVAGLRCYGGVAFGGYARDVSGDTYLVECVQAVHLGSIPFSFRLEMPKAGNWSVEIPIPEKVLESAFAPAQRKTLSDLRERFPEDRWEFQYLQMLLAN